MKLRRAPLAVGLTVVLAACATADGPSAGAVSPTPSAAMPPETPRAVLSPSTTATSSPAADALLATVLVDVRSGEEFTLAELSAEGRRVLLEPMAVWCTTCRAQQHEVTRAHELADFTSVSLDVDLTELPEDLAAYADREGFAWRFAMADAEMYRMLQDRFGVAATNPPSTPIIVVEPDGTVRSLEFGQGVRSAEELLEELGIG
jgi:thiol-disulfide isomerase/thioredoxin